MVNEVVVGDVVVEANVVVGVVGEVVVNEIVVGDVVVEADEVVGLD